MPPTNQSTLTQPRKRTLPTLRLPDLRGSLALQQTPEYALIVPQPRRTRNTVLAVMVAILLLIAATRIMRLPMLNLEKDEVWSTWITLGTVQQTIEWTGYDWPPGHFILLQGWHTLTGISPFALRISTVLTMLIAASLMFVVSRRLFGTTAAIMATLAFSGLGYSLFISTLIRGYMLVLTLFLLSFWFVMRYFERPSWARAIWLGLSFTGMFYIHTTAVFGMAMLVLFSLIMYRGVGRWFRLWIIPGLIVAALCGPYLLWKLDVLRVKTEIVEKYFPYVPTETRLINHYLDYLGQQPALWGALLLIAGALILERWRIQRRTLVLAIWLLVPLALYPFINHLDMFNVRHLVWVMVGIALWVGWGLALLPRPAIMATAIVLCLVSCDSIPFGRYEPIPRLPFVTSFETLKKEMRNGDVILMDLICANCTPIDAEEWDYFTRAYFPNGLTFITAQQLQSAPPQQYQRVWYVSTKGKETPDLLETLDDSRALSKTVGEEAFLFRLYEAPPDATGIAFENGMRLRGVELLNDANLSLVWREGDTVYLRLWWSADRQLEADYSEGTYFWDREKGVQAQTDSAPLILNGPQETSKWQVGKVYIEERTLKLPYPLTTGDYDIMLSVYQWWDNVRINAPGVTSDTLLKLGSIYVKAW
jgi:hypothetical protein